MTGCDHAPDSEPTSGPANQRRATLKLTNGVSGAACEGAGVSVQQASRCLANNSLGSASLLLKNQPAGRQSERSWAQRRAEFAEYMRRCVPVSEIITHHSGIYICNQTSGEWAFRLYFYTSKSAFHLHCQPGMVRLWIRGSFACE